MNPSFRTSLRGLLAAFVLLTALPFIHAGDISGRVLDSRGGYLPGASVVLVNTGEVTFTDREGRFRFSGVAGGDASVRVEYLGYADKTESVSVPSAGVAPLSITLVEAALRLDEFVVEGYREGRSKALQQKRTAPNVKDIISADSVGNLPDRNVAEALARVPGVNLDVFEGEGEGRFISIRGIEPNFNTVTLNGATLAAPTAGGREGRAMPLDVISSSQISQIEVVKSVTPDMDGNALGGSVNIKTASAFERRERFIFGKVEIGKNSVADDNTYQGELTYGNTFNDGKVGLAFSANYSKRPYVSHDLQANWNQSNGRWYPSTLELQPATGEKTRLGFNANLEFRPADGSEWFIRAMYNEFDQEQREQEFIMDMRDNSSNPVTFVTPTVVTMGRMRYEQRDFRREIDQTVTHVSVGGKREVGDLTVSGEVTYSEAKEDVPTIKSVQFRTGNVSQPAGQPWTVNFGSFRPVYLNAVNTPSLYPLRRFREEDSLREETNWTPRLDVRRDFTDMFGGRSGHLQWGAKYIHRDRFVNDNSVRPVNSSLTMATVVTQGPAFTFQDGRYIYPSTIDVNQAFTFLNANRSLFTVDPIESASNSIEDDYDTTEKILGLYAMASVEVNPRLTVLGGLRFEQTDAEILGFEFQERNGSFLNVVTNRGSFDYDNFLPNLQAQWRINDRSVVRAAFTGTIGRPQYEKAAPKSVLEILEDSSSGALVRTGFLEIGNPSLEPYESMNLDLAYEHYLASGGLFSIAVFHKEIDNPIYQFEQFDRSITYNGFAFDQLTRVEFRNADSAKVTGLELGLQLPFATFGFLRGGLFDGFGVEGNATFIDSETDIFERPGENLPFFRQPDRIFNAALYYEKHGFAFRIAFNRQTESLRDLSNNANNDRWDMPREYTDLQASYKLGEHYTLYVDWQNVFENRADRSYGQNSGRLRRSEFYGSYLRGGLRFRF